MAKHNRAWLTKREIFRLNQYSQGELRARLAAAMKIARRYSRQCDAYRAELVRLRQERDQLERDATGLAAELGELQSWYLAAMQAGRANAELAARLRAYDTAVANPPYQYPYRPAESESFDESAAATMVATEPLLAQDWADDADDALLDAK